MHQRQAHFVGAGFVPDVGFILVAEITHCAEDRIGSRLTQTAEGKLVDRFSQTDEFVDIAFLAIAIGDAFQDLIELFETDTAG